MMKIWIGVWAVVYLVLDLLDRLWETGARVMDSKAFAGIVAAADMAILLRILGVW